MTFRITAKEKRLILRRRVLARVYTEEDAIRILFGKKKNILGFEMYVDKEFSLTVGWHNKSKDCSVDATPYYENSPGEIPVALDVTTNSGEDIEDFYSVPFPDKFLNDTEFEAHYYTVVKKILKDVIRKYKI